MDESSKENEENLMLFHDNTDENRPEMNEQNVSETNLASKQHGSISEIDKVTDKTAPSNTVDSETPENIETGTELGPVRRGTRQKTQFTDRESVQNEEIYRQKRTIGGHQGRMTALINQLSTCITKWRGPDEIVDILESLEKAWQGYNNAYGKYLSKNLAEEEFARIEEVFSYNSKNHASCVFEAQEYLRYCQSMALQQQATAQRQSIGSKSNSYKVSKSSKSSKKEKAKMDAELKRLAATQAEEAAIFEAEMEKKKIEIEFQTREKVRKLKAEAALAERKAELMQEYDSDDMSSSNDENGSDRLPPPPITQLIKGEQTELWVKSCSSQTADNQALDNLESVERVNNQPKKYFENTCNRNKVETNTADQKGPQKEHVTFNERGKNRSSARMIPEISKNQISMLKQ